ncbi:metal ABC transporter solute-binding protein, Zn/Mn family [Marinospirillum insulare]|uniref:High-affinity zinc uptake system protein ZnuA n=1 Tax=Marinospirillum insulare TaxID=217169 RepID=A0ABQ5ZX04_9GAMM|nr:zinc ABC transporter substrate-binding protein [Marinospirillum insulare]GLR64001.1 cation ABC transporter substrate-binding protein [Marinospirillum insulare]
MIANRYHSIFMVMLLLISGALSASEDQNKTSVFVSILPQKGWVEALAGDWVDVEVMVPPGQSPAIYELSPQKMAQLNQAALYFSIGVPFEETWLPRMKESSPKVLFVDAVAGIERQPIANHLAAIPADRLPPPERRDRHVWLSPELLKPQLANMRTALINLLPEKAELIDANYQAYLQKLETLQADMQAMLQPVAGHSFMVFHPAWGYLAEEFNLRQIPIERDGKEPSPRQLTELVALGQRENVRVIFVQSQFNQSAARSIADALDAEILHLDPLAEDFIANMHLIAEVLAENL